MEGEEKERERAEGGEEGEGERGRGEKKLVGLVIFCSFIPIKELYACRGWERMVCPIICFFSSFVPSITIVICLPFFFDSMMVI